jgi:predicted SAM-dependent methyltransferase
VAVKSSKAPAKHGVKPAVINSIYVQYGCGNSCPPNWQNFDSSCSLRLERLPGVGKYIRVNRQRFPHGVMVGNIVAGLPLKSNSANGAYASHVLEHLAYDDFWKALKETYRILKPGGIFRAVVPDLESRAKLYCTEVAAGNGIANSDFMNLTNLGIKEKPHGILANLRRFFGGSAHLWMWDYPSLSRALKEVGFDQIRKAQFNDCEDRRFVEVEDKGRFLWSPPGELGIVFPECCVESRKCSSIR